MSDPGSGGAGPSGADSGAAVSDSAPAEIHLALGFHDHQPVGNFPEVFEEHYRRAYLPFLDTMERHPAVPFALHLTGPLLLWLGEEHADYLVRLSRLCAAGRLEMKGGGFYEPILAVIPDDDKHEQVRRLSSHLQEVLGVTPEGAWVAERVWEPHLARHLAEAGLQYATLDDSHFLSVGIGPREAQGYFVTEEGGRRFDLFPISKELRYLVPFQEPEATIEHLRRSAEAWRERRRAGLLPADAPPPLAVYDDDGEKFGGWPGTHEHVYGSGWLERFLTLLEKEAATGRLALTTLGAFRRRFPPLGRVYLPTGSYAEMLEWSGGYFRNFLVRYEEANLLHKRMLHTSRGVARAVRELDLLSPRSPGRGAAPAPPPEDPRPEETGGSAGRNTEHGAVLQARERALRARDCVLRAQCNDAYWHGIFGGLYLPHLRTAAYAALIEAEALVGAPVRPALEVLDLDLDGHDEVFLRSAGLTALVHPRRGGSLVCLDHLPSRFALLDTLRRRREPEHAALEELAAAEAARAAGHATPDGHATRPADTGAGHGEERPSTIHHGVRMKEPGLERLLFVDDLPRAAFLDRFYPPATRLRDLVEGSARELGDFGDASYRVEDVVEADPSVRLVREGSVAGRGVRIEKAFALREGSAALEATYLVRTQDLPGPADADDLPATANEVIFGPEINLTLLAGWAHDRYVLVDGVRPAHSFLADQEVHPEARSIALVDETTGLRVTISWQAVLSRGGREEVPDATLHRYGVVTVSLSEDGFERIYQATSLLPTWRLPLGPGTKLGVRLRLEVGR